MEDPLRTPVTRHRASTLLVASMAVGLLAACGTATAPGLETPSPISTGSGSASGGPSTGTPGSNGGTSTGGASDAALCSSSGTNYGPQYSAAAALKTYGTTTTANTDYGTGVEVSAQAPRVVSSPEERAPDDGNEYIALDIRAHLAKGSSFYISYIEFSLFDPAHNACDSENYSDVLPDSKMLTSTSLGDSTKDAAGSIVFQVKAGTDLTKLTLLFAISSSNPASVGWKS